MVSEDHEPYAFWDYLRRSLQGGNSRDAMEFQWHRENQVPNPTEYDPDSSQIDSQQNKTWDDLFG